MKTIELTTVLVFVFFSATVFAQEREDKCAPEIYEIVKRELNISGFSPRQDGGSVISSACRIWPYKPDFLLAAFAYDKGVEGEKQLTVVTIDKRTQRVDGNFGLVIGEDAATEVGEYSLKLDTARYQLAKDVRAFGVIFSSAAHGANCGDAYWGDELTLYVPEGKKLRPVLTLNRRQQRWLKGCPSAMSRALWEDAALTLSMAESSTNGFHDIVVTAKIEVNTSGVRSAGNHRNRVEQHTFRYDGTSYKKSKYVPWWLAI